jgi:uncharacterized protein
MTIHSAHNNSVNTEAYLHNTKVSNSDYVVLGDENRTASKSLLSKAKKLLYSLSTPFRALIIVTKDINEAKHWFLKAANGGHAGAQAVMGEMYWFGQGVDKDQTLSAQWYSKAATKDNGATLFNTANCILNGENHDLGISMLKIAAEQGNDDAQTSYDAYQGDVNAQISLGIMYSNGLGVEKDNGEAVKWFSKAAEQGSSEAQCFLGDMYAKGMGVIKDEVMAANLISMAAKQGHPEAQAYLGDMYWYGQGVKQDTEKAKQWLRLAAKQGQDGAADKLEEILESERKNSLTKTRSKSN